MPDITGGIARYDIHDPEDLAVLIDRGLIWRGGPKSVQLALRAIVDGEVPRPTRNVPPEVDAYLDKLGIGLPEQDEDIPIAEPESGLDEDEEETPA